MVHKALSCLIAFSMLFSAYASTGVLKSAQDVSRLVTKYDYLLTSHPQAHDESFRTETLEKFKQDLQKASASLTKEELVVEVKKLVAKIPTAKDREAFVKVLENSSKDELAAMMTSPELLSKALQGQGANFSFRNGPDIHTVILGLVAVLVIAVVVDAVINAIKYDYYYSYSIEGDGWVYYDAFDEPRTTCHFYYGTSQSQKDDMIDDAMSVCQARSKYPETCRFTGWSYSDDYVHNTFHDPIFYFDHPIRCWIRAQVKTNDRP